MDGLDRRRAFAAMAGGALLLTRPAAAQIASLEIFSVAAPGDGDDQLARAIAEGLNTTRLLPSAGPVSVPGDGGVKGLAQFVSGARPRPGLLVIGLGTLGQLVLRKADESLDHCRPLALLVGESQPVVVAAKSPIRTLDDLLAAIRGDPERLRWAGRLRGGADHQLALLTTMAAGGDPTRLNYVGGDERSEAAVMLLTGEADVATGDLGDLSAQIRGGTLRALALSSPSRSPHFDIPTFRELGVDVTLINWRGAFARRSIERGLISRVEEALAALVRLEGWRQLSSQRYWLELYEPADQFAALVARERIRLKKLFADAKL
ncbi:Bug family tripartite tricarboxylate transporter substrate binding protein [Hansschlegelia plantiphila]|nr:tripartite tricarboxylate transporter substrate-binding protein [Hansschlegelia plantiphila]